MAGVAPVEVTADRCAPAGGGSRIEMGEVLVREGRVAEAAPVFDAVLETDPQNARAWNGLGVCRYQLDDAAGAADAFERALVADPRHVEALQNLGDMLWSQGLIAGAAPLVRRLLDLDPGNALAEGRLRSLGLLAPAAPKVVLLCAAAQEGRRHAGLVAALREAGWQVRIARPALVDLSGGAARKPGDPVAGLGAYLDATNPALLMIRDDDENAAAIRAAASERGLSVLPFGEADGHYVLPPDTDFGRMLALAGPPRQSGGPPDTEPPPLATVVVRIEDGIDVAETVERVVLQDVDPVLIEILVVVEDASMADAVETLDVPVRLTVVAEGPGDPAGARGTYIVPGFHRDLADPDALSRRIQEVARARSTTFAAENLTPRSTARAVALIRGWINLDQTASCIESLRRHVPVEDLRIIYVDNGSDPAEFARLVELFPDVEHLRHATNHGSCRGINAGLALAALEPHEFVILLDNDTEVPEGDVRWLERWIGLFRDPTVGAAGAVTDHVAGFQQIEHTPETYVREWKTDDRGGAKGPPEVPALVSFAVMFRRRALEDIGWLADERFEPGNSEDYDLCLRMAEHGWRSVVAQSVWIHHRGSQTFSRLDFLGLLHKNIAKLVDKYGDGRLSRLGLEVTHHGR